MEKADLILHLSSNSRYIENALKHAFLAERFEAMWRHDPALSLQVYSGEIDAFGHDIVLVLGSVTRHVQLKASHAGAKAASVTINTALSQTPAGCAIWMFYDPANLQILHYRFFGALVNQPIPNLAEFKEAKHVKANSQGVRTVRPKIREVPKTKFQTVASLADLIHKLFGISTALR